MKKDVLGVDIGGVIIDRINDNTDTSFFSDNYLSTTAVPDVCDILRQLVAKRFDNNVHLVSKCGLRTQEKTLRLLKHHQFYDRTGVKSDHAHFCRKRHEKAGICNKLGITHFVDDRLEVLSHLMMVKELYLFQPRPEEVARFGKLLDRVKLVQSWQEILVDIM